MKRILQFSFFIMTLSCTQTFAQLNANFSASVTMGCSPLDSVQFTDQTTGGTVSTYDWDFGNSNGSSVANPVAYYPLPGVYTVSLTVSNATSTDTETKTAYITVFAHPTAHFTYSPPLPCTNTLVTFTDNSTLGGAPIVNWHWGFGDGTTVNSSTSPVTHPYSLPATSIPVSVIVTDS